MHPCHPYVESTDSLIHYVYTMHHTLGMFNIVDMHACIYSGGSRISERGGQSTPLGGSGGMLPQKIFNFRPSEVVSGAFWVENCFLRLL